jgi:glycosyltransferase involved in cell wall biosynthesis
MGRYIERMAMWWSRSPGPFDRIVLVSPEAATVPDLGTAVPVEVSVLASGWPRLAWEQLALPARSRGAAVLFCPSYTCPLVSSARLVVANHGIYEALPAEFSRWARLRTTPLHRLSARRATRVIANSKQTASDLSRFFGVPEAKIDVVYPAAAEVFFMEHDPAESPTEVARVIGTAAPYVLFVGKLARRRNVPNLIEAFARVTRHEGLPHHLVVVGPDTSGVSVTSLALAHGIADRVHWLPHLEQGPLARLYAQAELFALPTTYEGISWTMFEAMASGTPVLTVPHPTLAEGAGDSAYTVPSPSVPNLEAGLIALLKDAELRRNHAARGRVRAEQFSWEHAALATMTILDRVAPLSDHPHSRHLL